MAKKPLADRIATRNSTEFLSAIQTLPDPDPVLRKMGKDISTYRELLCEPRCGSSCENRASGVLSMLWDIDRGLSKSRVAKFAAEVVGALDVQAITSQMLEAPLFGMKPMEVLWGSDGQRTVPVSVDGLPQEWFLFDQENRLRLRTIAAPDGIDLTTPDHQYKFLLPRYQATYDNPYGVRVLSRVFWYVVFKRGGLRFWVTFTEKYGMPWVFGKYRTGADDAEKNRLLESLEALVQDGIGVLPDGDAIDTVDVSKSGASAQLYEKLLRFCDEQISIAILGHTGSSQSTPGRLGAEDSAMKVRADIIDSDRRIVEAAWNQLVRWIVDVNFGAQTQYPRLEFYEEEDVDQEQADRDDKLGPVLNNNGFRLSRKYFEQTYQFDPDHITEAQPTVTPAAQQGQGAQFAAPGQDAQDAAQGAVDTLIDGFPPELLQQQMEEVLKPVLEMISRAESLEEIQTKLAELFPSLDSTGLEKTLEKAFLLAETWGRAKAGE